MEICYTPTGNDLLAWRGEIRDRALELRAGRPAESPRSVRVVAFALALILHVAGLLALRDAMRLPPQPKQTVINVILLTTRPRLAPPTAPQPPPLPTREAIEAAPENHGYLNKVSKPPVAARTMSSRSRRSFDHSTPRLRLFKLNGEINIPDDLLTTIDKSHHSNRFRTMPRATSSIMRHKRPLKVRPNYFAAYWTGDDELSLSQAMWRHLTLQNTFKMPWGSRIRCTWLLTVLKCTGIADNDWAKPMKPWKPAGILDAK